MINIFDKVANKIITNELDRPESFSSTQEALDYLAESGMNPDEFNIFDAEKVGQLRNVEAPKAAAEKYEPSLLPIGKHSENWDAGETIARLAFPNGTTAFTNDVSAPRKALALGADVAMMGTTMLGIPFAQRMVGPLLGSALGGAGTAAIYDAGQTIGGGEASPEALAMMAAMPMIGGKIASKGIEMTEGGAPNVKALLNPSQQMQKGPNPFTIEDAKSMLESKAFKGAGTNREALENVDALNDAKLAEIGTRRAEAAKGVEGKVNLQGFGGGLISQAKEDAINSFKEFRKTATFSKKVSKAIDDFAADHAELNGARYLTAEDAVKLKTTLAKEIKFFSSSNADDVPKEAAYQLLSKNINDYLNNIDKSGLLSETTHEMAQPMRIGQAVQGALDRNAIDNQLPLTKATMIDIMPFVKNLKHSANREYPGIQDAYDLGKVMSGPMQRMSGAAIKPLTLADQRYQQSKRDALK